MDALQSLITGLPLKKLDNGSYYCPTDPGEAYTGKPRLSITPEEYDILSVLMAGRTVLEIGTGLGVSTCALAERAKHVYTVDPDLWVHKYVWPTFAKMSHVCAGSTIPKVSSIDAMFIDGDHRTERVVEDINLARALLSHVKDAFLVLHDVKYTNVAAAVREVFEDRPVFQQAFDTTHGLGVIRL